MADLQQIYDQIINLVTGQGEIKESQAELAGRLNAVEEEVKGHADKLENGVQAEIRELRGEYLAYIQHQREDTCFYLIAKKRLEEELQHEAKAKERRKWDFRNALVPGIILLLLTGLGSIAVRRLERKFDAHVVETQAAKQEAADVQTE